MVNNRWPMIINLILTTWVMKPVNKQPTVHPIVNAVNKWEEALALSLMSKYWNKVGENNRYPASFMLYSDRSIAIKASLNFLYFTLNLFEVSVQILLEISSSFEYRYGDIKNRIKSIVGPLKETLQK